MQIDNAKLASDDFRTKYVETFGSKTPLTLLWPYVSNVAWKGRESHFFLFTSLLKAAYVKSVSNTDPDSCAVCSSVYDGFSGRLS